MENQVIVCPHCQKEIPLTEAISHQIKAELSREFAAEAEKRIAAAEGKAKEAFALQLKDLQEQITAKTEALRKAQETELELRKKQRAVEEREQALELEITRKVDEQKQKVREEALKSAADEHRLKDLEKEKQIGDLRKQIDELKIKAEQGSQKNQGEVLELELEEVLRASFPMDVIEPVPSGIKGADLLQKVCDRTGGHCGTIIWEFKRTRAWSDGWLAKLKDDQREVRAEIAVLMSTALPKDVASFAYREGVWITGFASAVGLATALRLNLADVAMAKAASVGKGEKMEFLYNYLSGAEFRQRVQAIVESFMQLQKDLEQEKRAMVKIWTAREKQIRRIIDNTAGMYGDVQGIIGASLPQIEALELEALTAGDGGEPVPDEET